MRHIFRHAGLALLALLVLTPALLALEGDMVVYHDGTTTSIPLDGIDRMSWNASDGIRIDGVDPQTYPLANIRKITFENLAGVPEIRGEQPERFQLGAAYPNPFNASVTLPLELPVAGTLKLRLVNLLGQELLQRSVQLSAGRHRVVLNGENGAFALAASGIYLLRLELNGQARTIKLVYMK